MSVDWFLYSPSHDKEVMVGSIGLGGIQSYPQQARDFIFWAIDENIKDIILIDEYQLDVIQEQKE